jgi:hypothetical protein
MNKKKFVNENGPCWDGYKQVGMKMKSGREVPNCVPESVEMNEKNEPTNPALWSRAKSAAKAKYDVYPSAYANAFASKWYKEKGGTWKTKSESVSERLDKTHLDMLKQAYNDINKINPNSPAYNRLITMLDKLPKDELQQIADADIKFLSLLAKNRLMKNEQEIYSVKEGNAFTGALFNARKEGLTEFEFNGKMYPVKEANDETIVEVIKMKKSMNERISPKDMEAIKSAVQSASSFMNIGSELKKTGIRYIFATSPMPIYIVQDKSGNRVGIVNKKYATKPDFVVGDTAVGVMENKVNESASRTAMEIGGLTGMNKDAVQKFVDTHNLDIEKLFQYVKNGKFKERMDFISAVVGNPGNKIQKMIISKFGMKEVVSEVSDGKKRFMFDFYTDSFQKNTERETNYIASDLESAIKAAQHMCKVTGYGYVEIYYKDLFLGSMMEKNKFKFVPGKGYTKYKSTNESVNEATLINLKNNSDAQTIAAKSKLSYEDSWNAITSYLVATMGLPKALALVLKLEKEYNKIFSESKINEALLPADTKVVKAFFDKKPLEGRNLNTDGKVLKTAGIGSQEMYTHTPNGVKMVGKITGKYAQSLVQFVNKNYKSDLVESVNEVVDETQTEELDESLKNTFLTGLVLLSAIFGGDYINHGVQRALDAKKPVEVHTLHKLLSDKPLTRDTYILKVNPNQKDLVHINPNTNTITLNTSDISNINLKRKVRNTIKKINPNATTRDIRHMRLDY